jgi:hypothetical protein
MGIADRTNTAVRIAVGVASRCPVPGRDGSVRSLPKTNFLFSNSDLSCAGDLRHDGCSEVYGAPVERAPQAIRRIAGFEQRTGMEAP